MVQPIFTKLYDFENSYKGHLLKLKTWGYVIYCCHGNQLMEERLAKNMIKEANLLKTFSDPSQMMLKLDRNIRWTEI